MRISTVERFQIRNEIEFCRRMSDGVTVKKRFKKLS